MIIKSVDDQPTSNGSSMTSCRRRPVPLVFALIVCAIFPEAAFALSYYMPAECKEPWMIALPWMLASLHLAGAAWAARLIHACRWRALMAPAGLLAAILTIDALATFLIGPEPANNPYGLISLNAILGQVCADYR